MSNTIPRYIPRDAAKDFNIDHTGDGCLALGYYPDNPDGHGFYLWITIGGVEVPTSSDDLCEWGVYDSGNDFNWIVQGQDICRNIIDNRDRLIAFGRRLHSQGKGELTFETLKEAFDSIKEEN